MYAYTFNNLVMYSDPDGNWPKLSTVLTGIAVGAAIVAVGALCVTTGGLASVAIAGGGSMLMATATTTAALGVAGAATKVAAVSAGAATVSKVAESSSSRKNTKSHTVYGLQDGSGKIHYVGRTTDVGKRRDAHGANPARAGLTMMILADNLSYEAAKGALGYAWNQVSNEVLYWTGN